jgi:hypothetical protein
VDAIFAAAGTGTSVGLNIGSGKSLKLVGDVIDTNGNELLKVTATASAVNELTLANAATGGAPTLTASGSDTNIGMKLVGKGTGEVTARVNGADVFNASSNFGFKNRIINGAMVIDQRNAGASVTPADSGYTLDRWQARLSQASKFTVQQNAGAVTPPTGFTTYLGVTSSSAYSLLSGDFFGIGQQIEGFNTADLGWGTASAQTISISFWVRSSLTGTFSFALTNDFTRGYVDTFTVSTANTWEYKTVTIAGDTSGTWATNNTSGVRIIFNLGVGSSQNATPDVWGSWVGWGVSGAQNVVSTNGATFYITGVQLEKGSTATSFDYRPYGTELALCQRYYERITSVTASGLYLNYAVAQCTATTGVSGPIFFQTKRTSPTMSNSVATGLAVLTAIDTAVGLTGISYSGIGVTSAQVNGTGASGLVAGNVTRIVSNNNNTSFIEASAEL